MLLEQIAGAQAALEADIELLRHAVVMGGDGAALAMAQNQMSRLSGLQHRIEHAQGGGLPAIRAEVMASVAASQTLAQQARGTVANAHTAERALHAAQAEAHRVTGDFVRDFYERKIFDEHLDFATTEEERAYREREEARQRAITEARALGTPEGELRALRLAKDQMLDAKNHGADRSPDFAPLLNGLAAAEERLGRAVEAREAEHQAERKTATHDAPTTEQAFVVSPDIIASLRNAGVSVPASDASLLVTVGVRPTESGRVPT